MSSTQSDLYTLEARGLCGSMKRYQRQEDVYAEIGEYLPLGVWNTKVFEADAISMNSKNTDGSWCPIARNTFRVPILSQGTQGVRGKCREDSSVGGSKRPRMEVDGSRSSDTASSSSSSGKTRKENQKVKCVEKDKHK